MFKSHKAKNILSYFVSFLMLAILITPLFVNGQEGGGGGDEGGAGKPPAMNIIIKNPFKLDSIQGLIETIINDILMPVGGVVAVVMIMYAGFMYVTARGDTSQIKKATDALTWAVVGAAILLGASVISKAIGTTIDQLKT
ncbi:MAG: pilin [Candidatus Paceibacterota bacterium]|jgi:hypothetical protein